MFYNRLVVTQAKRIRRCTRCALERLLWATGQIMLRSTDFSVGRVPLLTSLELLYDEKWALAETLRAHQPCRAIFCASPPFLPLPRGMASPPRVISCHVRVVHSRERAAVVQQVRQDRACKGVGNGSVGRVRVTVDGQSRDPTGLS